MIKKFAIHHPIVQAPMAGVTTPKFVAACANAGILGAIGAGYLRGEDTRAFIQEVQALTKEAFMVNVFVPEKVEWQAETVQKANRSLSPIRQRLGLQTPEIEGKESRFHEQIEVIVEEGVKICSFTFGLPSKEVVKRLKRHGIFLIGTATTVEEAHRVQAQGLDAVVAQGKEAGGHRGAFLEETSYTPLTQLVSEICEEIEIPVIAAGGIATKERKEALLALGAAAVQIGTGLLVSEESGANPLHKKSILQSTAGETVLTKAFSGKEARGLENEFIRQMEDAYIAPYPIQNTCTQDIRKASAAQGSPDYMSLWAGESAHISEGGTVKEIISRFLS